MPIKSWPTAVVLCVAMLALLALLLAGPTLGVSPDVLPWLVGGGAAVGAPLLAAMRGLFHDDDPDDAERSRPERRGDAQ